MKETSNYKHFSRHFVRQLSKLNERDKTSKAGESTRTLFNMYSIDEDVLIDHRLMFLPKKMTRCKK